MTLVKIYIKLLHQSGFLNDYVFCSLSKQDKKKNKHISTSSIRSITKKRVKQIGLDPDLYGAHSYRTAFVHDAIAAGIPSSIIKKTGRWKSDCWLGYFHDAQYAQAVATSQLMKFKDKFETKTSRKKHKELLQVLSSKVQL